MDKAYSLSDLGIAWPPGPPAAAQPPAAPLGRATERVREASSGSAGVFVDEDKGWTVLTGQSKRDLSSLSQSEMQRLAAWLWETNMLANRLIELPLAYLVAEGVKLSCADPEHQKWLDAFWRDPINKMDLRLPTFARELALFGEQCWPTYVNDVNGHVRIGYLDPSLIGHVMMDPGNASQEIGVRTTKDADGKYREFRVVVRGEDDELFAIEARQLRAGYASGDAFYFAVNKFAAGRRGRSDLIAQMDWVDGYDEFLFDQMERAADLDMFIWDVKLTGVDSTAVEKRAGEIKRPARGSVRVHNEGEEWTAVAPDMKASDRAESARMFRNHALGGQTVPEHWFGGGGDVNRATSAEMGDPFFKIATMRQTQLRFMLQELGSYVLWCRAKASGQTPDWGNAAWKVSAQFPEMVTKDLTKLAAALQACVVAVASAIGDGIFSRETGLRIIAQAARRLDVEIDVEAELKKVEKERSEEEPDDKGAEPGQAQLGVPADLNDDANADT